MIWYLYMCLLDSEWCLNSVILLQDFVKTHLIEDTMMTDLADNISHGLPASYLLQ